MRRKETTHVISLTLSLKKSTPVQWAPALSGAHWGLLPNFHSAMTYIVYPVFRRYRLCRMWQSWATRVYFSNDRNGTLHPQHKMYKAKYVNDTEIRSWNVKYFASATGIEPHWRKHATGLLDPINGLEGILAPGGRGSPSHGSSNTSATNLLVSAKPTRCGKCVNAIILCAPQIFAVFRNISSSTWNNGHRHICIVCTHTI